MLAVVLSWSFYLLPVLLRWGLCDRGNKPFVNIYESHDYSPHNEPA